MERIGMEAEKAVTVALQTRRTPYQSRKAIWAFGRWPPQARALLCHRLSGLKISIDYAVVLLYA